MLSDDIANTEAEIDSLYEEYCNHLEIMIKKLADKNNGPNYRDVFNNTHRSATAFFNKFDNSLNEYTSLWINPDQAVNKAETTLNIIPLIFKHWEIITSYCKKFQLPIPKASPTAYGAIQRIIKKFYPDQKKELRKKFKEMNLPTEGFDSKATHTGWKKRAPVEVIIGMLILMASGILNFVFDDITGTQFIFLKLIMAIGGSITLMGLGHGFIKIKWNMSSNLIVVAGGTAALFILLYFFNPPSPPDVRNNNPQKIDTTPKNK